MLSAEIRCVAPIRVDGGSTWARRGHEGSMHPALVRWLEAVRKDPGPREEERRLREKDWITPLPLLGDGFEPEGVPWGLTTVTGAERDRITWHCTERAYVTFWRRLNPETGEETWYVRCQAKARELYAAGLAEWMRTWLGGLGELLGEGEAPNRPGAGWSTTQLHLNSDFEGLEFEPDRDFVNFTTARVKAAIGTPSQHSRVLTNGDIQALATIELGTRVSDVHMVCYRKTQHCRQKLRVRPERSMYAPLWRAHGWSGGEITRVEFRLRKKGLFWRDKYNEADNIDLHDPSALLDDSTLLRLWGRLTQSRRLVVRDDERRTRCSTDPRWIPVQRVSAGRYINLRQVDRRARVLSTRERDAKDIRKILSGMASLVVRHRAVNFVPGEGDVVTRSSAAFARVLEGLRELSERNPTTLFELVDGTLPTRLEDTLTGVMRRAFETREFEEKHRRDSEDTS